MSIEAIMIYYNSSVHPLGTMIDMGTACVYLAILATIAGILEALLKIC